MSDSYSWSPDGIQCSSGLAKYFVILKGLYREAEPYDFITLFTLKHSLFSSLQKCLYK